MSKKHPNAAPQAALSPIPAPVDPVVQAAHVADVQQHVDIDKMLADNAMLSLALETANETIAGLKNDVDMQAATIKERDDDLDKVSAERNALVEAVKKRDLELVELDEKLKAGDAELTRVRNGATKLGLALADARDDLRRATAAGVPHTVDKLPRLDDLQPHKSLDDIAKDVADETHATQVIGG